MARDAWRSHLLNIIAPFRTLLSLLPSGNSDRGKSPCPEELTIQTAASIRLAKALLGQEDDGGLSWGLPWLAGTARGYPAPSPRPA